jgi:hypothetical protein
MLKTGLALLLVAGVASAADSPLVALAKRTNRKAPKTAVITNDNLATGNGRVSTGSQPSGTAPTATPAAQATQAAPATSPAPAPTGARIAGAPAPVETPTTSVRNVEAQSTARNVEPTVTSRSVDAPTTAKYVTPLATAKSNEPPSTVRNIDPQPGRGQL